MHVEIWADIACPWCYVGKRRFEAALERFEDRDAVEVTWRSFELDPQAPAERALNGPEHLAEKYGIAVEEARRRQAQLADLAAGDGLQMRFDLTRGGNTFDAHRLTHLAAGHGVQDAMEERLLRAHHTEGELLSDHATLARLAGDVGLPWGEVRDTLGTERYAEEVRADEAAAEQLGIRGVPCFVVDRRLGASGAQPPEQLLELLRQGRGLAA